MVVVLQGDVPSPDPTRFEEAVTAWRARVPMKKEAWAALSEEQRQRAFTVANVTQVRLLSDVWNALDAAIERGETYEEFKAKVGDKLRKAWGGENPSHLETVFRTNVQAAYSHGRYAQMTDPVTLQRRPYWKYSAIQDGRTTEICRPLNGLVIAASDPFWNSHIPPLHFNCRSTVIALSKAAAERQGITEEAPELGVADGFGLAPGKGGEVVKPDLSTVPEPLKKALEKKQTVRKPEPTSAPATTEEAHRALEKRARAILGEKLHNPEVVKRTKAELPGALGTHHPITGQICIREDVHERLEDLFRRAAAGEFLLSEDTDAFHVLLHEELHGLGKWKKTAAEVTGSESEMAMALRGSKPLVLALEEGSVELASLLRQRKVGAAMGLSLPEGINFTRRWREGELRAAHAYRLEVGLVETLCRFAAGTAKATPGESGDLDDEGHRMLDGVLYQWHPAERLKNLVENIIQRNTPVADHLRDQRKALLTGMTEVFIREAFDEEAISRSVWRILKADAAELQSAARVWAVPMPEGL